MKKNDKNFLDYAFAECEKKGFKIIFSNSKFVLLDECNCSGFFDEAGKQIQIATQKPFKEYFPIFVHEFCHFKQWSEKEPLYTGITTQGKDMWDWLEGEELPIRELRKSIKSYQLMEFDCEKRTVQMMDKFNLSIDKSLYIKTANTYILYYSTLEQTREWYKTPPYKFQEIVDLMPDTFVKCLKPSKKFRRLVEELCY